MDMPKPLQKIKRPRNLYMEAMESIKASIFRGDFGPGQPLPSEKDLTGLLGVSRPVVREALRALQMQGFLDIRRGNQGGTFVNAVNDISFQENLSDLIRLRSVSIADLANARLLIEPEVFRLAARNASPAQLAALATIVTETVGLPPGRQRVKLGMNFHRLVAKMCTNLFYGLLMDTIMDFLGSFIVTLNAENLEIHNDHDHREIFAALSDNDGEHAATLLRTHIEDLSKNLIRLEQQWLQAKESGEPT
jgi:GntR family transcriptional regulator, transcriptional repressor for pyruvate dehydrogenase complex